MRDKTIKQSRLKTKRRNKKYQYDGRKGARTNHISAWLKKIKALLSITKEVTNKVVSLPRVPSILNITLSGTETFVIHVNFKLFFSLFLWTLSICNISLSQKNIYISNLKRFPLRLFYTTTQNWDAQFLKFTS